MQVWLIHTLFESCFQCARWFPVLIWLQRCRYDRKKGRFVTLLAVSRLVLMRYGARDHQHAR